MEKISFSNLNIQLKEKLQVSPFIHPTNSCYWFWWSIYNEDVYKRIYELKWRDSSKPFFITIKDLSQIWEIAQFDSRVEEFSHEYPEKIFTFILNQSPKLPNFINPGFSSVGIQVARWPLIDICECIDTPIFWTSANISLQQPIYRETEIEQTFWNEQDLIFLSDWNLEMTSPSTIIDLTDKNYKILRWSL